MQTEVNMNFDFFDFKKYYNLTQTLKKHEKIVFEMPKMINHFLVILDRLWIFEK